MKELYIGIEKNNTLLSMTRSKKISPKYEKDLGVACHTPPPQKANKGKCQYPALVPSINVEFRDWMDQGWVMAFPLVSLKKFSEIKLKGLGMAGYTPPLKNITKNFFACCS